jgi:hypothetical protein
MGLDFGKSGDNRLEHLDVHEKSLRGQLVVGYSKHGRTDLLVSNPRDHVTGKGRTMSDAHRVMGTKRA